jgi:hypothetical protein
MLQLLRKRYRYTSRRLTRPQRQDLRADAAELAARLETGAATSIDIVAFVARHEEARQIWNDIQATYRKTRHQ